MPHDALARRLRHAPPQPGERVRPTDVDFEMFEAIERHGPLPTLYLYEFTKHARRDYANLQYRLTKLYNGDASGPFLTRPPRQFESFEARYQHAVYGLATRAKLALAERGTLARAAPPRASPFVHQLMTACAASSIELGARARGLRYIPREEIIARTLRSPFGSQGATRGHNPLAIATGNATGQHLIPDDLFGLEYPGVGFRFFALEIDRNTESLERRSAAQSSFGTKVRGYIDVLKRRAFESCWGVPNLTILTVTTNGVHADHIREVITRQGAFLDRFAFAVEPSFGSAWRVPRGLLTNLLDAPWQTPQGLKDIARP